MGGRVLTRYMVHSLVVVVMAESPIAKVLIGVDFRTAFDVLMDCLVESDAAHVAENLSLGTTATFAHSDHSRLAYGSTSKAGSCKEPLG